MVAAAALIASVGGLQVAPNSAKSTSLRMPAEARYQPYVEGKTDRFLISETKNEPATKAPTGYAFSTLQEDDNDILQEDDDVHIGLRDQRRMEPTMLNSVGCQVPPGFCAPLNGLERTNLYFLVS
ncbi:hypothetical protein PI125_g19614 [Phytophthora idaei]|nr:hypothetical protein PI125_g19614 [Phytophthora idaei]